MRKQIFSLLSRLRSKRKVAGRIEHHVTIKASSTNIGVMTVTEAPPIGGKSWFKMPIVTLNEALVRIPTTTPIIPPDAMFHIGMLAIAWGEYEQYFDRTLCGLTMVFSTDAPGWRMRNYKRRRELFREICKNHLEAQHPNLTSYYLKILDDSPTLHAVRNLILHGRCAVQARATGAGTQPDIDLLFDSGDNDGEQKGRFKIRDIENVCYEILHLSGRLKTISREEVQAPTLSSQDKLLALEIWNKGQMAPPILERL
jgi:hypothetical protein